MTTLSQDYTFVVLETPMFKDPADHNEQYLGPNTLGINVDHPSLVMKCGLGTIGPDYSGGGDQIAAITAAMTIPLPNEEAILVTEYPNLDSFGAMALLLYRTEQRNFPVQMIERLALIEGLATSHKSEWSATFSVLRYDWWQYIHTLNVLATMIADPGVLVLNKVLWMKEWLYCGANPDLYKPKYIQDLLDSLSEGIRKYRS